MRVHPNVVQVAGSAPTRFGALHAVRLWLGPRSAIGYTSAAEVLRLDRDTSIDSTQIHAWVPADEVGGRRGRSSPPGLLTAVKIHRSAILPAHHRRFVDGIPVTSAARTIVDLAALLDPEPLESAAESARRMGIMTVSELERVMDDLGPRPGNAKLRRYVETSRDTAALQSRLELKTALLLRRMKSGVDRQRQWSITTDSHRSYRVDFADPESMVVIECDGFRWHGNRLRWKLDRTRLAAIELQGWRVVAVNWADVVERPDETAARIRIATRFNG